MRGEPRDARQRSHSRRYPSAAREPDSRHAARAVAGACAADGLHRHSALIGTGNMRGQSLLRKEAHMGKGWRERRTWSLAASLGILSLAMLPGGADSADTKPIVIAVPVGLSGVNSVVAPAVVQSGELAVEEIKAKGGVLGRKLEMVPLDDE